MRVTVSGHHNHTLGYIYRALSALWQIDISNYRYGISSVTNAPCTFGAIGFISSARLETVLCCPLNSPCPPGLRPPAGRRGPGHPRPRGLAPAAGAQPLPRPRQLHQPGGRHHHQELRPRVQPGVRGRRDPHAEDRGRQDLQGIVTRINEDDIRQSASLFVPRG